MIGLKKLIHNLTYAQSYFYINWVRFFKLTELYQPTYNPRKLFLINSHYKIRDCDDRVSVIQRNVDFNLVNSYIDIGSQLGYFVFKLHESNHLDWSCGIEKEKVACGYANSIAFLNDIKNVAFFNSELTFSSIKTLPNYDMISFLNVFHHIVYFNGFESADFIMRQLYKKCNSYFVFETGQFDEKGYYWSEGLKFMGKNCEDWLANYLKDIGYREIKVVARFPTHLTGSPRSFFICKK